MRNREIIAESRYHLKGNFWRAIIIMIIVATIPFLISYGIGGETFMGLIRETPGAATDPNLGTIFFQGIVTIIIRIISSLLSIGEKWSYLHMVNNEKLQIKTVFRSFIDRPGRNIWHNILQLLLIFIWLVLGMIGMGLLYLLVNWLIGNYGDLSLLPMIITSIVSFIIGFLAVILWFIAVRFWFILSEYILYEDQTVSAYEALKFSRRMMKEYKWQLFRLAFRIFAPLVLLTILIPVIVVFLALVIQEQVWLLGLIAIASYIGYFIYTYVLQIRWKASLAVFYQMIKFEKFDY